MSRAHFLDSTIVWRLATGLCGDGFNVCPTNRYGSMAFTPKTYINYIPEACTCHNQIDSMFGFDVRQHLLAYRRASAPQGRSRCISPFQHTCTNRNPPGSLSFGPRRSDRAEWTTTRHIDLTLFISSPTFFPSLAGRRLLVLSLSFLVS